MDRKRINRSRHFRSRKMDGNGTARSGVTAREIRKKKSLVFDFSIGSRGGSQLWRTNPLGFEQNISRCVSVCWLNPGFRSNWIRGCASLIFHSSSFSRSLSREEGLPSRRFATTCSNGTSTPLFRPQHRELRRVSRSLHDGEMACDDENFRRDDSNFALDNFFDSTIRQSRVILKFINFV